MRTCALVALLSCGGEPAEPGLDDPHIPISDDGGLVDTGGPVGPAPDHVATLSARGHRQGVGPVDVALPCVRLDDVGGMTWDAACDLVLGTPSLPDHAGHTGVLYDDPDCEVAVGPLPWPAGATALPSRNRRQGVVLRCHAPR